MSCDEEAFQQGRQEIERTTEARLEAVAEETKEKIRQSGLVDGKHAITVITNRE